MENIFREGDYNIFHYNHVGKGKISKILGTDAYVNFDSSSDWLPIKELSFEPYTLEEGGLSHQRPINEDDLSLLVSYGLWQSSNRLNYGTSYIDEAKKRAEHYLKNVYER